MSWPNAQSYCRSNYTDLATVDNCGDMERLKDMAVASGVKTETWIGLTRADSASWLWSLGETGMSHESANFTNWDPLTDPSHECGGMTAEGRWLGAPCATTLPFVCQEDEASGALHVILQNKTWKLAREYCQLNNMDLASARSWDENDAVEAVIYESRSSLSLFWIGLVKDMWEWSDQSNSSFRAWSTSQPNNDGQCTLYKPSDNTWFDRGCANNYPFYCYIGKRKGNFKQVVRVEMTSNSRFNLDDPAMSEAILIQIQKKYEGVKLRWNVQPDGKIFQRKEEKKVNDAPSQS
ncbi:secretory phospholipase A2 receptor-like [Scophthalmus maximus]|uniref:secretory phospholipase A2 receptor-like n=1 Tax=Scophthalmus maximus TaxID=52904 RepID=UPI001FA84597|nr:secretory phospholipase A2 receptor-like [Scophthalmus maximus]